MKRWFMIGALVVTHVWLALVAFTGFNALLTKFEIDRRFADPLYRVASRLGPESEAQKKWPAFDEDLAAVHTSFGPSADAFRLLWHLRHQRPEPAAEACRTLGWSRCDAASIAEMGKLFAP